MTHTLPQLLPHCSTPAQQFCQSCRDRERGRAFRRGVLDRQGIKGVDVDFECPKKKPWKPTGLGDTLANWIKRLGIKPCGGCKKRQAALNKLVPYK